MQNYHKYAVLFTLTNFYIKTDKAAHKLDLDSGSVSTQLMHTWIIQWNLLQWVFLSHLYAWPVSDNTLNIMHHGQVTIYWFKLHPVLVNLLEFKFALWFTYVIFPCMCLCIIVIKQRYLHLLELQYSQSFTVLGTCRWEKRSLLSPL